VRYTVILATSTAMIASLSGGKCAAANPVSDSTGATSAASAPGQSVSPADVAFMQGMIGHHAQALRMVALAPTHGASAKVLLLCKKIDISQHDEIATMTQWLKDHHQAVPDTSKPMAMAMPGMLTPAQMKQLEAAHDTAFDRLFLTFMIQHHNGALEMVRQLFATNGAAQTPEVFQYATDVSVDQTGEIDRMRALLDSYSAPSSPRGSSPR